MQHTTQPGRALRAERLRGRHAEIRQRVAGEYPDLASDAGERLATLLTVLMGSSLLIDLVDALRLDVDQAAAAAIFAIDACVEKSTREGPST